MIPKGLGVEDCFFLLFRMGDCTSSVASFITTGILTTLGMISVGSVALTGPGGKGGRILFISVSIKFT